jgi:taurine dioxygenase
MPLWVGRSFDARICGVELRRLDACGFAAAHPGIDHQVSLFRDQRLSNGALIAFSRRFGDPEHAAIQENGPRIAGGTPHCAPRPPRKP